MVRRILFNNGNLGRMGKTTLAYTVFKDSKEPFIYFTNDLENASIDLQKNVTEENLSFVAAGEEIDIDPDKNIIFDFGGKPDQRLLDVAKIVDTIVVPIAFQSTSELKLTIQNINALLEQNENIIIVINNTDAADAKLVRFTLNSVFPKLDILEIAHSKYVRRLANEDMTVFGVANTSKRDATQLNKKIIPQFKELFSALNISQ